MILRFGRCRESELRIMRHESRCWLKPIRFSLNSISFGGRMSKLVNRRASNNRWLAFKEDRPLPRCSGNARAPGVAEDKRERKRRERKRRSNLDLHGTKLPGGDRSAAFCEMDMSWQVHAALLLW